MDEAASLLFYVIRIWEANYGSGVAADTKDGEILRDLFNLLMEEVIVKEAALFRDTTAAVTKTAAEEMEAARGCVSRRARMDYGSTLSCAVPKHRPFSISFNPGTPTGRRSPFGAGFTGETYLQKACVHH